MPAAIIARELNMRMIDTVCVVTYDWQEQNNAETVLKGIPGDGEDMLVIDDLVDTGKTLQTVQKMPPKPILPPCMRSRPESLWLTALLLK